MQCTRGVPRLPRAIVASERSWAPSNEKPRGRMMLMQIRRRQVVVGSSPMQWRRHCGFPKRSYCSSFHWEVLLFLCCVERGLHAPPPPPPSVYSLPNHTKRSRTKPKRDNVSGTTMSLASMLRSTLASPLTSWTYLAVQRAAFGASLTQIRSVWQEVVRQVSNND